MNIFFSIGGQSWHSERLLASYFILDDISARNFISLVVTAVKTLSLGGQFAEASK